MPDNTSILTQCISPHTAGKRGKIKGYGIKHEENTEIKNWKGVDA